MTNPENPACPADGRDADSALLSRCYMAMQAAMNVIDVNEGPGMDHAKAVNALADCRVEIENRSAIRAGLTKNEFGRPLATPAAAPAARDAWRETLLAAAKRLRLGVEGPRIADELEALATPAAAPAARDAVTCSHEAYQGACAHCGVAIVNGAALQAAASTQAGAREADCYSDNDGDTWLDCPNDSNFVHGRQVGDEYELTASVYTWKERFRVTKVPDDESDDYEVERITADAIGGSATQDVVPVARLRELAATWRTEGEHYAEQAAYKTWAEWLRVKYSAQAGMFARCAIELDAITTERSATADTRTDTEEADDAWAERDWSNE